MNVAINKKTLTFIGRGEYRAVWAKAIKEAKSEDIVIGPEEYGRTFSCLDEADLLTLYKNTTGQAYEGGGYKELVNACQDLAGEAPMCESAPELRPTHKAPAGRSQGDMATPTGEGDSKPHTASQGAGAKPKEPKSYARPKEGTSTGKVWDIADRLKSEHSDKKPLRQAVIAQAEAEGVGKATAQVQFGKWWNTIGAH